MNKTHTNGVPCDSRTSDDKTYIPHSKLRGFAGKSLNLHQRKHDIDMKQPKIVHLQFKDTDTHEYFSSIKAMFRHHDAGDFGIKYRSIVNVLHDSGVYQNKRIIVRIGNVKSSPSNPNVQ